MKPGILESISTYFHQRGLVHAISHSNGDGLVTFPSGWYLRVQDVQSRVMCALLHADIPFRLHFISWAAVEAFCEQHPTYLTVSPSSSSSPAEEGSSVSHG